MIATVQHPTLGEISQPANPIKVGGVPPDHRPGPSLGQDTDQVLRDYAGASAQEIAGWRASGVL